MPPASVLLVVQNSSAAPEVTAALKRALTPFQAMTAPEVVRQVRDGAAHTVVMERSHGWSRLARDVVAAGACALVVGPHTPDAEQDSPPNTEWVRDLEELVPALERAKSRSRLLRSGTPNMDELLERALTAELINRFSQTIAAQMDMESIRREVVLRVRELCDADDAALFLVDSDTGELIFEATEVNGTPLLAPSRLEAGQGTVGAAALEAGSALAGPNGTLAVDFTFDTFTSVVPGSVAAASLLRAGDVIGVVAAVRAQHREPLRPLHVRRLEDLARHVALAVHNLVTTIRLREAQGQVLRANLDLELKVRERTEQISRAKLEWERTFDAIRQPISLQDGFVLRRANQAYAEHVGVSVKEIPGKKCHQLFAGRDTPCPGCPLLQGRGSNLEGEVALETGTIFQFNGFWNSQDPADPRVVINYKDVTGQKTLESRLRESERLAALGQLASGAAHEINNPIGFVISNLRNLRECLDEVKDASEAMDKARALLKEKKPTEAAQALAGVDLKAPTQDGLEMIDESLEGTKRVSAIVRGLRDLSRQEIGKVEPADVNASVTRAVRAEFQEKAGRIGLDLKATSAALVPPLQLDQVLGHILHNAHQAVGDALAVTVRTREENGEVLVEVEDQGPGIPKENLHRLYEPFFTTRGVGKGIGLGLTAAYGIVRRHNGNIDVHSEVGKGATFILRLQPAPIVTAEPGATLDA